MRAHLDALKAALSPLGYATHLWAAPDVTPQYLILSSRSWESSREASVCGTDRSLDTEVRVTAVAGTPEGVEVMLRRVRGLLGPDEEWVRVPLAGRHAQTHFARGEFIGVDDSVKITGTDRHPGVGVDSYRLVSEPA